MNTTAKVIGAFLMAIGTGAGLYSVFIIKADYAAFSQIAGYAYLLQSITIFGIGAILVK